MRRWKLLIIATSAAAALVVGIGSRPQPEQVDLLAFLTNALNAIT
jgi:hypothetical protein